MNLRKGTIQDELDQFVALFTEGLTMHKVSASAFCQARQKLNPRAMMSAQRSPGGHLPGPFCVAPLARAAPAGGGWLHRAAAVDAGFDRRFRVAPKGSQIPLGRLSVLYDVLNTVVVEADSVSTDVGERVLAGEHLAATRADVSAPV